MSNAVSTISGSLNNHNGRRSGTFQTAEFCRTTDMLYNPKTETVYIVDSCSAGQLREINLQYEIVTVIAGDGNAAGYVDGPAVSARFGYLNSIALDRDGNVYLAESDFKNFEQNRIRFLNMTSKIVSTVTHNSTVGYLDGSPRNASFGYISGLAVDSLGNVFVSDYTNNVIRRIG